jgi:type II secretory pathway pseudopilin PulG
MTTRRKIHFPIRPPYGFSYAEILLAVVLLGILLVPALQSLSDAIAGNASGVTARQIKLRSKMEEVLSVPFTTLYTAASTTSTTAINTTYSDAAGQADRRVVVLYRYDTATNTLSTNDTGLIYISVYFEAEGSGNALSTLTGRWW